MKTDHLIIINALKESVKSFCQKWIEYHHVLTVAGDLNIQYDEVDAIAVRFDEKLYGSSDIGNTNHLSSANLLVIVENHNDRRSEANNRIDSVADHDHIALMSIAEQHATNNEATADTLQEECVALKEEIDDDVIEIENSYLGKMTQIKTKLSSRKKGRPRKTNVSNVPITTSKSKQSKLTRKYKRMKLMVKINKSKDKISSMAFSCDLCSKTCATKPALVRHLQTHGEDCLFCCQLCNLRFSQESMLSDHMKQHGSQSTEATVGEFVCRICQKQFVRKKLLTKHMQEHSPKDKESANDKDISCDICSENFSSVNNLASHMQQHADSSLPSSPLQCVLCSRNFSSRNMLNRHIKRHAKHRKQHIRHEKVHECVECHKKFTTEYRLSKHTATFHKINGESICNENTVDESEVAGKDLHECTICHKTLRTYICLRNHMKLHTKDKMEVYCDKCGRKCLGKAALDKHKRLHGQTGTTLTCPLCNKWFSHESLMKVHIENHNKQLPCELCGQVFNGKRAFKAHQLVHRDMLTHVCEVCGDRFRSSEVLNIHSQTHNLLPGQSAQAVMAEGRKALAEKKAQKGRHACEKCGKRFAAVYHLQIHMNCHTGERPFKCDQCDKTYRTNSALRSHKLSHSGIRPYECQTCQKRFKCKSDLNQHMKSHSSETPYECQVCGTRFAYRWSWQQHERGHLGLKPYLCNICGKSFTQACTLRGHQKIHERDSNNDTADANQTAEESTVAETSNSMSNNELRRKKPSSKVKKSILPAVPPLLPSIMITPEESSASPNIVMDPSLALPLLTNRTNNIIQATPPSYTYQAMTQTAHALLPPIEYAGMIPHHMAEQYHLNIPEAHVYPDYSRNRFGHAYQ